MTGRVERPETSFGRIYKLTNGRGWMSPKKSTTDTNRESVGGLVRTSRDQNSLFGVFSARGPFHASHSSSAYPHPHLQLVNSPLLLLYMAHPMSFIPRFLDPNVRPSIPSSG